MESGVTYMNFIKLANEKTIWRGLDYYEENKVISWEKIDSNTYSGMVAGSNDNEYLVFIDIAKPIFSSCECPCAEENGGICKHMIALYFTVKPKAAAKFLEDQDELEGEEESDLERQHERIKEYINRLSKAELRQELFDALIELEDLRNDW